MFLRGLPAPDSNFWATVKEKMMTIIACWINLEIQDYFYDTSKGGLKKWLINALRFALLSLKARNTTSKLASFFKSGLFHKSNFKTNEIKNPLLISEAYSILNCMNDAGNR